MNKLSRFVCSMALLGAVSGGIILGIGFSQGAKAIDLVRAENRIHLKSVIEASRADSQEDIFIKDMLGKVAFGKIELVPAVDDCLSITVDCYGSEDDVRISDSGYSVTNDWNLENDPLTWSFGHMISNSIMSFKAKNTVLVEVPTWFKKGIYISSVNSDVVASLPSYNDALKVELTNGTIEVEEVRSADNIKLSTVNGDIRLDVQRVDDGGAKYYSLSTVNGSVAGIVKAGADFKYSVHTSNGEISAPNSNQDSISTFAVNTINGDVHIESR